MANHPTINTRSVIYANKDLFKKVATPTGTTATTTGVMPHVKQSIHPATVASGKGGRSDKRSENDSSL